MTEKTRMKIEVLIYSIVSGITVAIVMMIIQGFSGDKVRINQLENTKVDRIEFKSELEKKADKDVISTMKNQIQFLYENEIKKQQK
jgi:hypothetical protein